jgi:UMF1 family MFS transporter
VGALVTSKASAKYGNVKTLIGLVTIWTIICCCVYFVATNMQFYLAASVVGVVMGGVQSLSRSTYSKYLPLNIPDTASYFSFYDVTEKLSIVVGLFCFAIVEALTHEMRNSALALDGFFAIGLLLLIILLVAENKSAKSKAVSAA